MNGFIRRRSLILLLISLCVVVLLGIQAQPGITQPSPVPIESIPTPTPSASPAANATHWQPATGTWEPVPAHREDRGSVKVVWLQGTPYDMGYQHGSLLHDELATLPPEVYEALRFAGRGLALGRLAMRRSFPDVIEECQGLTDATQDLGMTMDACMTIAYGDVYQEHFGYLLPEYLFNDGCAGFVAMGDATVDGRLYHARTLDNNTKPINYWVQNPTVFVRQPNEGIPHVFIGVPGAIWPNSAINAEGISISLDTAHPRDIEQLSLEGASNVQLMAKVMQFASSYEEAKTLMNTWERARANLILIADGQSKQAGVFEILGRDMGIRDVRNNGVIYMTNHFVAPETIGQDPPPGSSSLSRYQRLEQLLEPDSAYTRYGNLDAEGMVEILRDRTDPNTFTVSPLEVYDDDVSVGGNGPLRQEMFDNENLHFWVAGGSIPVPENPFVCFSLGEMIGLPNAVPCPAPAIP